MNYIFISPNFPKTYKNFCDRLKRDGVNVLGIGDEPYDNLDYDLKSSLNEYYKVSSLENFEEVYRAVAFFTFKYGKIDWLESNNEYWLEQDAKLRTEYHITTGIGAESIESFKSKAEMKKYYKAGGVPTARQSRVTTIDAAREFISLVGYPVIVKPENGVGASHTYKLSNEEDLKNFFSENIRVPYVMEEFIFGDIFSYDAVIDSKCEPLFESATAWPPSIMDIVNEKLDLGYYVLDRIPEQLAERGRATVKAFNAKSRFVHLEFFRLREDKEGLGKKGDFIGLEVNMRPAGGYTPDMMNYAHSTDVYQLWADMAAFDKRLLPVAEKDHCCAYAGRRDCFSYKHSDHEILEKYGKDMVMHERLPDIWYDAMGSYFFMAKAETPEKAEEFIRFVCERN